MTTAVGRLQGIWESPRELAFELSSVDHKKIGIRYIVTALAFFGLAGISALVIRVQLAAPDLSVVGPETYNQLFTMHGTAMIFLFATPMLSGFGNYLIPLMIGSRDMAFPRLNAFGYWVFLFSGLFLFSSFLLDVAPDGGWFAYVPLTGPGYSPNAGIDFWALGLIFLSISSTAGAVNFIVSILKLRAPGMSVNRMPLFCWAILATSFAIVFALPPLTIANILMELDRQVGTQFYQVAGGGMPLLWQHLFWFFGHPDVYIIFLPAVGMVSTVIPVFVHRPMIGYIFVALAMMMTAFISFGVWVHHMFATGIGALPMSFFSAASLMITIPSGVQVFAWIGTVLDGEKPRWTTPFLFMMGFLVLFVMGGVTGVMFASVPFDWQATDSYFVVAHFHYVLFGGAVFPIFGALHYWIPKMTGRMLSERLGQLTFWLMFLGFNLTFFPMHIAGLLGMPRRVYTYHSGLGWGPYNLAETIGAFILAAGILTFVLNFLRSLREGPPAGDNPWDANTLEWSTTSPPPPYNFEAIPLITSRDPLWDDRTIASDGSRRPPTTGLLAEPVDHIRDTLASSLLDAEPDARLRMPADSMWPLVLAFGLLLFFYGLIPTLVAAKVVVCVVGVVIAATGLFGWLWPGAEVLDGVD